MRLADDADNNRALLDGLGGILDLEYPALWGARDVRQSRRGMDGRGASRLDDTYKVTESLS